MKLYTFKKGIYPDYNKELTKDKPIEKFLPVGDLVFSMSQHIGAPCKPVVKKGDKVLVGQLIGEQVGFVSAPIHSSVSGTVKAVEKRLVTTGSKEMCIVIENDKLYKNDPKIGRKNKYKNMSHEEIVELVKNAGLVGMGGAGFPTYIKLTPPEGKTIKHIMINGAECEPYLTSDHRVMLEETEAFIGGLKVLLYLFPGAKGYIGIEDNKMDVIKKLKEYTKDEPNIEVAALKTKYPQGSEKHLIYALIGKEVPSGGLPADVGCMVQNVDSVAAIWKALETSSPIMRRIVTVSGDNIERPGNYNVKIGTSLRELLEYVGWDEENTHKVIAGGPMMGTALTSVDVPIVKGSNGILCFSKERSTMKPESNCIKCNKCVEVCPCILMPIELNRDSLTEDTEAFLEHNGMDCLECGSCSFICPANRHLVQSIRTAKADVRKIKEK